MRRDRLAEAGEGRVQRVELDVGDDLFGGHFVKVRTDADGVFVSTDLLG